MAIRITTVLSLAALLVGGIVQLASADSIVRIEDAPAAPILDGRESGQRLLVTGYRRDGSALDLTGAAAIASQNARIARVDSGVLFPVADGITPILVQAGGRSASLRVTVRGMRKPFRWT